MSERPNALETMYEPDADAGRPGSGRLLAALVHELRNPVAGIAYATEVLERMDGNSRAALDARQAIGRQTRRLVATLQEVSDLASLLAGDASIRLESYDLAPQVAHEVELLGAESGAAPPVEVDLQATTILADRARVEQIVRRVLGYAARATPHGGRMSARLAAADAQAVLLIRGLDGGAEIGQWQPVPHTRHAALALAREFAALLGGSLALRENMGQLELRLCLPQAGP